MHAFYHGRMTRPVPANLKQPAASIALAACSFALTSSGEIQLTPSGSFTARDGRPFEVDSWYVTDESAPRLLAKLAAHKDRIVIDYEHQTLHSEKNGQPAPAAAWFNGADVEYRPGAGLFVVPEFTAAAKTHIHNKEYQYFSPVISYDTKTGEVLDIVMGAITNYAAIDGMQAMTALAAARFEHPQQPTNPPPEENAMHQQLIALLGLSAGASEEEVMTALKAVMQKNTDADSAIAAAKAETPADTLAAMKAMQTELAELKTKLNDDTVAELVDAALGDGRLLPAQQEWATNLGKSNLASLKGYLDSAAPVAALKGNQTGGKQPAGSEADALDSTALAVCRQLNVAPADYQKTLNEGVA